MKEGDITIAEYSGASKKTKRNVMTHFPAYWKKSKC